MVDGLSLIFQVGLNFPVLLNPVVDRYYAVERIQYWLQSASHSECATASLSLAGRGV